VHSVQLVLILALLPRSVITSVELQHETMIIISYNCTSTSITRKPS